MHKQYCLFRIARKKVLNSVQRNPKVQSKKNTPGNESKGTEQETGKRKDRERRGDSICRPGQTGEGVHRRRSNNSISPMLPCRQDLQGPAALAKFTLYRYLVLLREYRISTWTQRQAQKLNIAGEENMRSRPSVRRSIPVKDCRSRA